LQIEERRELEERLERSRAAVLKAVENLAGHQWRFTPPEGGWTIAQCLEHVTHTETRIIEGLVKQMSSAPANPTWVETLAGKEELMQRRIPSRERKVVMPEVFDYPQGVRTGEALVGEFQLARDRSIQFLREAKEDIRQWAFDHALFKTLHGGQWMWMIALHAERHAAQMEEVRALPEFPAA
jgi:uncharacterized damage-inducible protein DinB